MKRASKESKESKARPGLSRSSKDRPDQLGREAKSERAVSEGFPELLPRSPVPEWTVGLDATAPSVLKEFQVHEVRRESQAAT